MIAVWMLYSILVTGLLLITGGASEYVTRALRRPTRMGWVIVMVASLLLSARALADRRMGWSGDSASTRVSGATDATQPDAAPRASERREGALAGLAERLSLISLRLPFDASRWQSLDAPLATAAVLTSAIALLVLAGAVARNRRLARTLSPALIEGVPVLVSHDLGPLLLGVSRFRVVLPRWVLDLPPHERRIIIAHEQEHARAGDPALLLAGAIAVALQPWNVALWAMLWRLRFATEADCDTRVLRTDVESRAYGALLVKVYEHSVPGLAAAATFVARPSHLEWRIVRMMSSAPRLRSPRSGATLATAVSLSLLALSLQLPAQVPAKPDTPHFVRAAGPADFEPLVQRTVADLFAGITLTDAQRTRAVGIVRHTQRQQWDLAGQGVPPSKRRRPHVNVRDSVIALAVRRDSALAALLDSSQAREQFIERAAETRQRQFQHLHSSVR